MDFNVISAVATAVSALVAAVYSYITYKILCANEGVVNEMREQSIASYRPYVSAVVFMEPGSAIFKLKVFNSGRSAARNLRLRIDKRVCRHGDPASNLSNFAAFSRTIESFPPGAELTFSLGSTAVVFGSKEHEAGIPKNFLITADYEFSGRSVTEPSIIDLEPYLGTNLPEDRRLNAIRGIENAMTELRREVGAYRRENHPRKKRIRRYSLIG